MDNYSNYSNYDNNTDLYCEGCGARIEEPAIEAADTEYEREVNLCPKCFNEWDRPEFDDVEIL